VHLTEVPEAKDSNGEPGPRFVCPITQLPCGSVPFTALATCGHVFSSRALREVSWARFQREICVGNPGRSTMQLTYGPLCVWVLSRDLVGQVGTQEICNSSRDSTPKSYRGCNGLGDISKGCRGYMVERVVLAARPCLGEAWANVGDAMLNQCNISKKQEEYDTCPAMFM
jgi:hypothetical protein